MINERWAVIGCEIEARDCDRAALLVVTDVQVVVLSEIGGVSIDILAPPI